MREVQIQEDYLVTLQCVSSALKDIADYVKRNYSEQLGETLRLNAEAIDRTLDHIEIRK